MLGFTGIWMQKMDPVEFMKTQIEESGRADKIPPDQLPGIIEQQAKMMPIFGWVVGPVFIAIMLLVIAGSLMFVFRFFYSGEVSFKQALAIVVWIFLAVGIVSTPVTLAVLSLKGDWNINPQDAVQANLGLLLEKSTRRQAALGPPHQHRRLRAVDGLPARGRLRRRQPQGDGLRHLGRRDPLGDHRPLQGRLVRALLISCPSPPGALSSDG